MKYDIYKSKWYILFIITSLFISTPLYKKCTASIKVPKPEPVNPQVAGWGLPWC